MASSNPKPKKKSGTFKSEAQALSIVEPVVAEVAHLLKERGLPVLEWSQENLTRSLVRLERGKREGSRTFIFEQYSIPHVVNMFDREVLKRAQIPSSISSLSGGEEHFMEVEYDYLSKAGPIGEFLPLSENFPPKMAELTRAEPLGSVNWAAYHKTLDYIKRIVSKMNLRPYTIDSVLRGGNNSLSLDGTTNGCIPVVISGWKPSPTKTSQADNREAAFRFIAENASQLYANAARAKDYSQLHIEPICIVFQRVNEPKGLHPLENEKYQRPVIAPPKYCDTVLGATVQRPMQVFMKGVYCRKTGIPTFLGYRDSPEVDKGMQLLLEYASKIGERVVSVDYSHFDRSVNPRLHMDIAAAVASGMNRQGSNIYQAIVDGNVNHSTLILPYQILDAGPHGLNSGMIFTNNNDSWINLFIALYGYFCGYYELDSYHSQGDDGVGVGKNFNPKTLGRAATELGFTLHDDKGSYLQGIASFLKRDHYQGRPGGVYPVSRTLIKSMVSESDVGSHVKGERYSWEQTFKTAAQANVACFNPLIVPTIDFLKRGDPHHLGADVHPNVVLKLAGEFAERYMRMVEWQPYKDHGMGRAWADTLANGVIRGEKVPTEPLDLFNRCYGIRYQDVTFEDLNVSIL